MSSLAPMLVALLSLPSSAQIRPSDPQANFLFGEPRGSLGFRAGAFVARTDSDIYQFFKETLTLDGSSFVAPAFGVDVGLSVASRVDVVFALDFSRTNSESEDRAFVDEDDFPILQKTNLTILPLTANLKFYLGPRGRGVSRYAYVPARVRPYLGGGGGFLWYELKQEGDFVDRSDLTVFTTLVSSDGWGLVADAFGGIEIAVGTRWFLSFEARYLWADAELAGDFVGFEPIDLSGLKATAGINLSF